MGKALQRLFTFYRLALLIVALSLLSALVYLGSTKFNTDVKQLSQEVVPNSTLVSLPVLPNNTTDDGVDQNVLLALTLVTATVGVLYTIFGSIINSQQFVRLMESTKRLEENQESIMRKGKQLQQENVELIKVVSLINKKEPELVQPNESNVTNDAINNEMAKIHKEFLEIKDQLQSHQNSNLPESFFRKISETITEAIQKILVTDRFDEEKSVIDVPESIITSGIYEFEFERIKHYVLEYPDIETGGDLFGFWTHSGAPVVLYVLGPGPNSIHLPASFYQDEKFLKVNGELLNQKYGLQHIGEWHSHHKMSLNHPSGGDENTINSAISTYGFQQFLLCIANVNKNDKVSVGPYLFEAKSSKYKMLEWKIFAGKSPFRVMQEDILEIDTDNMDLSKAKNVISSIENSIVKTFLPEAWYSSDKGKAFLKELESLLKTYFASCEMRLNKSKHLYFVLKNKSVGAKLRFPEKFPREMPVVIINAQTYTIPPDPGDKPDMLYEWIYGQVVNFVENVEI